MSCDLNLCAAVVAARVAKRALLHHRRCALRADQRARSARGGHIQMVHRVIVQVESGRGHGVLPTRHRHTLEPLRLLGCAAVRASVVFRRRTPRRTSALGLLWAAPIGGRTDAPGVRALSVEVIDINGRRRVRRRTDPGRTVWLLPRDLFRLPRAIATGTRLVSDNLRPKVQERRMEADRVATSFEHHTLQIVVMKVERSVHHPRH